jgi:hypothetical protein
MSFFGNGFKMIILMNRRDLLYVSKKYECKVIFGGVGYTYDVYGNLNSDS